MERLFSQTLSFDDLEVLVLVVVNGGATPREVEDSLGMSRSQTKGVFQDLVRRGLLDWQGGTHAPADLPLPWSFGSTVFQLTPMARSLRRDETFTSTAFSMGASVYIRTLGGFAHHGDRHVAKSRWDLNGIQNSVKCMGVDDRIYYC